MNVLSELKRRNVFKVAVAYGAFAWILVSVADILLPLINAPDWVMKGLLLFVLLSLPLVVIFAWVFELTPEGLKRTEDVEVSESIVTDTGRKLNYVVIGLLSVALLFSVSLNLKNLNNNNSVDFRPAPNEMSLAVLPFTSRSTDPDNVIFADGIHDDLLTTLASIDAFKVISRTSVLEYRDTQKNMVQIGSELGVAHLLEGAVQRSGDKVRINVQLIDARTDEHLWAEIYDEQLTPQNIFEIQSKISQAIASELSGTLNPQQQRRLSKEPTENFDAYIAYRAGKDAMYQRGLENIRIAKGHFEKAVSLDDSYALAYAGLATAAELLWVNHFALTKAKTKEISNPAIRKALELDPDNSEILAVAGLVARNEAQDDSLHPAFSEAESYFKRAIELNPNNVQALMWYAGMLDQDEQYEAAVALYTKARELDPLARIPRQNLMYIYSRIGQSEKALELALDTVSLFPDYAPSYGFVANHLASVGKLDEAIAWYDQSNRISDDPFAFGNSVSTFLDLSLTDQILDTLQLIPEDHPAYHMAQAFRSYGIGEREEALARLDAIHSMMEAPPDFVSSFAAQIAVELEQCAKARRFFESMHPELYQERPLVRRQNVFDSVSIAYCLNKQGQQERSKVLLQSAKTYTKDMPRVGIGAKGYLDALIFAVEGDPDEALERLSQAIEAGVRSGRFYSFWSFEDNPMLTDVREDPRFSEMLTVVKADVDVMRDNVLLAQQNADWSPLLDAVKDRQADRTTQAN